MDPMASVLLVTWHAELQSVTWTECMGTVLMTVSLFLACAAVWVACLEDLGFPYFSWTRESELEESADIVSLRAFCWRRSDRRRLEVEGVYPSLEATFCTFRWWTLRADRGGHRSFFLDDGPLATCCCGLTPDSIQGQRVHGRFSH